MPFPAFALRSPPPTTVSSLQKLPRPRGLWKAARETPKPLLDDVDAKRPSPHDDHYGTQPLGGRDQENFFLNGDTCCRPHHPSPKKRKTSSSADSAQDEIIFWDYSRKCNPQPERLSKWITRTKIMITSSIASLGQGKYDRSNCGLEDWEDLKELFSKAVEIYENEDASEAIPVLRGVIHECHRFMRVYPDPSVVYATPSLPDKSMSSFTPPEERLLREWTAERPPLYPPPGASAPLKQDKALQTDDDGRSPSSKGEKEKKCKCKDLPTAFHTIFGTALFLFGNLIAQDHSLALQGEPSTPAPYWLSALDVFQIGENLPIRLSGRGCPSAPEDWRMAIVWGRTLVNLTDEILTRQKAPNMSVPPTGHQPHQNIDFRFPGMTTFSSVFAPTSNTMDEPIWPADSPFALIAIRRPPSSYRLSLNNVTPHELLQLAQDQFYRGIFHMPHQRGTRNQRSSVTSPTGSEPTSTSSDPTFSKAGQPLVSTFSRTKELYTIGSEVLLLAEKLDTPAERLQWAGWADGIFSQMKMESVSFEQSWKTLITSARGRCCLIVGSARAEEMDNSLENGDLEVLNTEEANEAREALRNSITFLEKARGMMMMDGEIPNDSSMGGTPKPSDVCCSSGPQQQAHQSSSMVVVTPPGSYEEEEEEEEAEIQAIIDDGNTSVMATAEDTGGEEEGEDDDEEEEEESYELAELRTLLSEALLTLANLTLDLKEREELYARARKEGRGTFELDEADDRMDES